MEFLVPPLKFVIWRLLRATHDISITAQDFDNTEVRTTVKTSICVTTYTMLYIPKRLTYNKICCEVQTLLQERQHQNCTKLVPVKSNE